MSDRLDEIRERLARAESERQPGLSLHLYLSAEDVAWLVGQVEAARQRLYDIRIASRAGLNEPLEDAVAGLAAVFSEHMALRDRARALLGSDFDNSGTVVAALDWYADQHGRLQAERDAALAEVADQRLIVEALATDWVAAALAVLADLRERAGGGDE
jgi:hypothetical protein